MMDRVERIGFLILIGCLLVYGEASILEIMYRYGVL
jgi:hypothetical protein